MQCKATSKQSKKRCRRQAINGGTVCSMHGGGAPQVIAKAKIRLAALVDPALDRLEKIIKTSKHDASGVSAAKDILDRAGLKPKDSLEVSGGLDLVQRLRAGRERVAKLRKAQSRKG